MFNASYSPGIFYTALITGALPNIPITYSFWVLNLDRTDAPGIATRLRPNIKVEFRDINDVVLATINTGAIAPTTNGNLAGDWYQFTANLNLNVNAFKVIFINNETGGLGNDLAIDDIVITQTLCDRDGDGIADVFDLDSDNDGIEDVVEAGMGNLSNGKGKIDVTWVDANGNGLHDDAEATAALPALDSDGDGQPNYIDLDSDNDSLFDVDESGTGNSNAAVGYVNGDGDITGDGRGDGPESETFRSKDTDGNGINELYGDGILDIYDYNNGAYGNLSQGTANANPATTYLKDTDGDGIPDYLDITSNGSTFDIANNKLIYDYKTIDANNDGIIDGATDIDKDGILDTFDTNTAYFGSPRDLHTKLFLDFDGRNDYGQSTALLGGLSSASLMAWIDLNSAFSTDGVIVGQNNFQIRITSAKKLEAVINGTAYTYNTVLNVSQWYNVAATYDGTNLKLYLNGALVMTQAKTGAIAADASLLTIGKDPSTNTKYFKGKIDEVRVFNVALSDSHLQRMVYQEIQDTGSQIRGAIVPKNIATSPASLSFANLLRYYRMDVYKDDIIDDLTTPATDLTGTKIYNHKNIYVQQAPMPFLTERTGDFATAANSPTKEIRGMDIMDQDWSIVKVQHDITETSNNIDLGMLVDPGKNIVMNNDTKIQNDWYLKLDGKIDLVGKSQLVQTTESDLDVTSAGSIERDQQGQSNKYNYNYWCSPVSPINITANNTNYTVADMLKDGTTSTPQNINWVAGYDGSATSPISLARYWLYTFDNYVNAYANWVQILETTPIRVGQGFTLKGSGAASGTQNYTFTGKPNNGTITTNTVGDDQLLLTGNPYPSSLDADAFITDNISSLETFTSPSTDGTLYFWEHYATNNTHVLRDYQGGYAVRNLTGGLAPSAAGVDFISQSGTPSRGIPNRYIPVGQGFFVNGKVGSGGTVTFKNSQRGFYKEDDAVFSNIMYKTTAGNKTQKITTNNNNDPIAKDTIMKIRLGFDSNNLYHRQVLLGFMNEKATSAMDYGYDGLNMDDFPNDMYLLNGENQLVIEGEGFFDANVSYPIGVKTDVAGTVKFMIDDLENFDPKQAIFIYDTIANTYHNIRNKAFEVDMPIGVNNARFSLRFKDKTLTGKNSIDDIKITHIQNGNILIINNKLLDVTVQKVILFNISGQPIAAWKIENQEQQNIQIPIKSISSGVYIAKVKTSKGDISKKIIVN
ncbi:LamG-like jellyroll fold domain-containing protein [Flavobacterium sp. UBA4120]|nr:LamG-like jellyroll fold domain-containing protein [Flavobacterium sp. UBA4120]